MMMPQYDGTTIDIRLMKLPTGRYQTSICDMIEDEMDVTYVT